MILTCPSCTTRYFADDAAIGPQGRAVRCAQCKHVWYCEGQLLLDQAAPDDLLPAAAKEAKEKKPALTREQVERARRAAQTPATPGAGGAARLRAEQAARERRDRVRAAAGAWGAAAAVIAIAGGGAVIFREDVASAWPASASAFAAVGLDVNVYGLEFSDLEIERGYDGPTPTLVVSGAIRNISGGEKPAPPVRLSLRDEKTDELYHKVIYAQGGAIAPGAAVRFRAVLENPPVQAVDLEATFASAREALQAGAAPTPPEQPPVIAPAAEPLGDVPLGEAAPAAEAEGHGAPEVIAVEPEQVGALEAPMRRAAPLELNRAAPAETPLRGVQNHG